MLPSDLRFLISDLVCTFAKVFVIDYIIAGEDSFTLHAEFNQILDVPLAATTPAETKETIRRLIISFHFPRGSSCLALSDMTIIAIPRRRQQFTAVSDPKLFQPLTATTS